VRNGTIGVTTVAEQYISRERFLTELTLDPAQSHQRRNLCPLLDEGDLILSTIHSAMAS